MFGKLNFGLFSARQCKLQPRYWTRGFVSYGNYGPYQEPGMATICDWFRLCTFVTGSNCSWDDLCGRTCSCLKSVSSDGSSEECINDLKASACLEEAVPIEWFHHGSIKDPDFLIHRLEHVKAAVAWAYGKRKLKRCMMMDALRLSAHPGPCWSCLSVHVSLKRALQWYMACLAKDGVIIYKKETVKLCDTRWNWMSEWNFCEIHEISVSMPATSLHFILWLICSLEPKAIA